MPVVTIADDEISFAEQILLPENRAFDPERRNFIRNLNTLDLQAAPGSGKTTALLAKLVILERHLPLENSSGILVLSHTNTAVDELSRKIKRYCPQLFSFPHFIGTIQSFVDEFLAQPYYTNCWDKKRISHIDNDMYLERLDLKLKTCLQGQPNHVFKKVAHIKNSNYPLLQNYRFGIKADGEVSLLTEINGEDLIVTKPRVRGQRDYQDYLPPERTAIIRYLKSLKIEILKEGILCYDDAYYLAERYIQKYPHIIRLLQKRFRFAFVDEMQDMDIHQYTILEKIFYENGGSLSSYQRIGDRNQAIYNGEERVQNIWIDRPEKIEINGSLRLSQKNASVIQSFALEPKDLVGLNRNEDGSEIDISPHILVYSDASIGRVLAKFADLIKDFRRTGAIPENAANKYYAIAWNTVWGDPDSGAGKVRLSDYHANFSKEENRPKYDYPTLESYLNLYDKSDATLYSIRENILRVFVKLFRLQNIRDSQNRMFNRSSLLEYLKDNLGESNYHSFRLNMFTWSLSVVTGSKETVLRELREYTLALLAADGRPPLNNSTRDFIESTCPLSAMPHAAVHAKSNSLVFDEMELRLASVHSVKGQTHTATLYLESCYYKHESEHLLDQFKSNPLAPDASNRKKQAAKMAYVGMSRPTHFLGVAVHVDRYEAMREQINENWVIVDVV